MSEINHVDINDYDVVIDAQGTVLPTTGSKFWKDIVRPKVYADNDYKSIKGNSDNAKLRKTNKSKETFINEYKKYYDANAKNFKFCRELKENESGTIFGRLRKKDGTVIKKSYVIASNYDVVTNIKRGKHDKRTKRQREESICLDICLEILNDLRNHTHYWIFNKPVDPIKLNLPDYFDVVKKPMDLGTIRTKLNNRSYKSIIDEFKKDVLLTFDNAMLYNEEGHQMHTYARELKSQFEQSYELNMRGKRRRLENPKWKKLLQTFFHEEVGINIDFMERTRTWVFQKFDDWINKSENNDKRILILAAPAGFGKTQIMLQIRNKYYYDKTQTTHQHGADILKDNVIAWHFFKYDQKHRNNPKIMLLSLAYQLGKKFPFYATMLNKIIDEKTLTEEKLKNDYNVNDVFTELLKEPLKNMNLGEGENKTYVIVMDALDECCEDAENGKNDILDCIRRYFLELPEWIKIFITSRPEIRIQNQLKAFKPWVMEPAQDKGNQNDIKFYVDRKLKELNESNDVVLKGNRNDIINNLIMKSGGLILHAKDLIDQLKDEKDPVTNKTIDSLSSGNQAYENRFRKRIFNQDNWTNSLEWKIVRMITVAAEPMSLDIIKDFTCCDQNSLYAATSKLSQYLNLTNNKISFYHKSLQDWLTNTEPSMDKWHEFIVDETEAHQFVGTMCLDYLKKKKIVNGIDDNNEDFTKLSDDIDYDSSTEQYMMRDGKSLSTIQYVLRYGISHLYNGQKKEQAQKLLLSVGWITTRLLVCKFDYNIIHDYDKLERNDTIVHLIGRAIRLASNALRRNPRHLPTQLVGRLYGSLEYHSKGTNNISKKLYKDISSFIKKLKEFSYGYEWWCPVGATFEQAHDPLLLSFNGHGYSDVVFLKFSPDDTKIASCDDKQRFWIWNANSGEIMKRYEDSGTVRAGVWVDNLTLASTIGDNTETIRIWSTNETIDDIILKGHTDKIYSIKFSHDKKMVASGGRDNCIRIWDLTSNGQCKYKFEVNHKYGMSLSWSPNDEWLVASTRTKTLSFWKIASGESTSYNADDMILCVDWCPNIQTSRVAFSQRSTIKVLDCFDSDSSTFQHVHTLQLDKIFICLKWSPDGKRMAIGTIEGLQIWNVESNQCDINFPNSQTYNIEWSHNGMKLASGSLGELKLWSLSTVVDDHSHSNTVEHDLDGIDQTKNFQWLKNVPFTKTVSISRSDQFKGFIKGHAKRYSDFIWLKHDSNEFLVSTTTIYKGRNLELCRRFWNPLNGKCVMKHKITIDELKRDYPESMEFPSNIPSALDDGKYDDQRSNETTSAIHPREDNFAYRFKRSRNNIGISFNFYEISDGDSKSIRFFELKKTK